jgi:hypothetical protein
MGKIPNTISEAVINASITFMPLMNKIEKNSDQYFTYLTALSHGIWICMSDTDQTSHETVLNSLIAQIDVLEQNPNFKEIKEQFKIN